MALVAIKTGLMQSAQPSVRSELIKSDSEGGEKKNGDLRTAQLDEVTPQINPPALPEFQFPYSGSYRFGTFMIDENLDGVED